MAAFVCLGICAMAQNAEEEAMKKVIAKQFESSANRDFTGWASSFRQDSSLTRVFISSNGYFPTFGWDSAKAAAERDWKVSPKPFKVDVKRSNFQITANGEIAWLEFDQVARYENDTFNYASHEVRLLVKENDGWKIAKQVSTNTASFDQKQESYVENNLNTSGYVLLAANKINEAIEVFKLNVKLFPKAWNTYDSLGEAYALAGNKKLAIENYEKSIKLNPKSEGGPVALAKLKAK